jgi:hypothetical protein
VTAVQEELNKSRTALADTTAEDKAERLQKMRSVQSFKALKESLSLLT